MRHDERDARVGDLVAVVWEDAWCDEAESGPTDWWEACPVTSYGVLLRYGDVVSVGAEVMPEGAYRAVTHIPAGIVKEIRRLRRPDSS